MRALPLRSPSLRQRTWRWERDRRDRAYGELSVPLERSNDPRRLDALASDSAAVPVPEAIQGPCGRLAVVKRTCGLDGAGRAVAAGLRGGRPPRDPCATP